MGFDGRDCLFGLCLDPHTPDDTRVRVRRSNVSEKREREQRDEILIDLFFFLARRVRWEGDHRSN